MSENRCENCKHFFLKPYGDRGVCRIILPPWVKEDSDSRLVHRKYKCDLYKPEEVQP